MAAAARTQAETAAESFFETARRVGDVNYVTITAGNRAAFESEFYADYAAFLQADLVDYENYATAIANAEHLYEYEQQQLDEMLQESIDTGVNAFGGVTVLTSNMGVLPLQAGGGNTGGANDRPSRVINGNPIGWQKNMPSWGDPAAGAYIVFWGDRSNNSLDDIMGVLAHFKVSGQVSATGRTVF